MCAGLAATIYVNESNVIVGGPDNGDVYTGTLNGTSGKDVIVGTNGDDMINGFDDKDHICGLDGQDTIHGGTNSDFIYGGNGNDNLYGDAGIDQIFGGDGDDYVEGGEDNNTVFGHGGDDEILGGDDTNYLFGGSGSDIITGGAKNDTIQGGDGNDTLCGLDGKDSIRGNNGDDTLCGGAGDDRLTGDQGDDTMDGGTGDDYLSGAIGTDICANAEQTDNCEDTTSEVVFCADKEGTASSSSSSSSENNSSESSSTSSTSSSSSEQSSNTSSSSDSSASTSSSSSSSSSMMACTEDSDLLAYWKFDEETGSVANDTVSTNDGTLQSGAAFTPNTAATAFSNASALATQTGGYADFGDVLDMGTSDFSTSLWFKTTDNDGSLIAKSKYAAGAGRWFTIIENGSIKARFDAGVAGGLITVPAAAYLDGNYHHIVTTYDRDGVIALYVDGNLLGTADISVHSAVDMQTTYPLYVGRYQNVAGNGPHPSTLMFNGSIDDVRVYARALLEDEVDMLFAGSCNAEEEEEIIACQSTDATLAAHYQFESSSIGTDSTIYNNEAASQNGASMDNSTTPPLAYSNTNALALDGTDDYLLSNDTTGLPTASSPRTIALWMNQDTITNQATLVSLGNGATGNQRFIVMAGTAGGQTYLFTDGINVPNNIAISGDEIPGSGWHHIAFSYDGAGNWAYYLDGALKKNGTFPIAILTDTNAVEIGARHDSATGYFDGHLDDVRIYSSALSDDEIADLYAGNCNGEEVASSSSSTSSSNSSSTSSSSSSVSSSSSSDGGGNGGNTSLSGFSVQNGNSGGRRGDGLNVAINFINFIGGNMGLGNGLPPAGFGGTENAPLTDDEISYICSVRRGLPDNPVPGFLRVVIRFVAGEMDRPVSIIEEAFADSTLCLEENLSLHSIETVALAEEASFPVDSAGIPVSTNPVWNACIRNVYNLEQIRNNQDTTDARSGATPRTCADYHTRETWYQPDLKIFFTYQAKPYLLELPEGYRTKEVQLVVQK